MFAKLPGERNARLRYVVFTKKTAKLAVFESIDKALLEEKLDSCFVAGARRVGFKEVALRAHDGELYEIGAYSQDMREHWMKKILPELGARTESGEWDPSDPTPAPPPPPHPAPPLSQATSSTATTDGSGGGRCTEGRRCALPLPPQVGVPADGGPRARARARARPPPARPPARPPAPSPLTRARASLSAQDPKRAALTVTSSRPSAGRPHPALRLRVLRQRRRDVGPRRRLGRGVPAVAGHSTEEGALPKLKEVAATRASAARRVRSKGGAEQTRREVDRRRARRKEVGLPPYLQPIPVTAARSRYRLSLTTLLPPIQALQGAPRVAPSARLVPPGREEAPAAAAAGSKARRRRSPRTMMAAAATATATARRGRKTCSLRSSTTTIASEMASVAGGDDSDDDEDEATAAARLDLTRAARRSRRASAHGKGAAGRRPRCAIGSVPRPASRDPSHTRIPASPASPQVVQEMEKLRQEMERLKEENRDLKLKTGGKRRRRRHPPPAPLALPPSPPPTRRRLPPHAASPAASPPPNPHPSASFRRDGRRRRGEAVIRLQGEAACRADDAGERQVRQGDLRRVRLPTRLGHGAPHVHTHSAKLTRSSPSFSPQVQRRDGPAVGGAHQRDVPLLHAAVCRRV